MTRLISFLLLSFCINTFAADSQNTISLYEQPNSNSKVVATIEKGKPIMPIFSKDNWIKIADPSNGNVGWISNDTLKANNMPKIYVKTFSQGSGQNGSTQVIQYTGNKVIDEKQMNDMIQDLQKKQGDLQKAFNQLMEQSVTNFNEIMKQLQILDQNALSKNTPKN